MYQIDGYRVSCRGQHRLQSVMGERCLLAPDCRGCLVGSFGVDLHLVDRCEVEGQKPERHEGKAAQLPLGVLEVVGVHDEEDARSLASPVGMFDDAFALKVGEDLHLLVHIAGSIEGTVASPSADTSASCDRAAPAPP